MAANEFDIIGTLDTKQIQQGAKKIEQGFKNLGNKIDDNAQRVNKFGNAIKTVAKASVALFAIDKIVEFGRKVVDTRGEMQRYSAVLENTLGNAQAAAAAQALITKEAAKSNFSVRELTGSYVKLANQGLLATSDQLVKLQDLANSTGKGFDQLAEAIIDAQTGEFERLKEFGIRASKQGDQVEFAFKGVKTQVDFTSDSIQKYLIGLGDIEGVTGSTAAISKTFEGRISNLGDQFLTFLNDTGKKLEPFINLLITGLSKGLDILSTALNSTISGLVATINYFITLYNIFSDFLDDIAMENLPNDEIGFKDTHVWSMLYNFQKDAVIGAINAFNMVDGIDGLLGVLASVSIGSLGLLFWMSGHTQVSQFCFLFITAMLPYVCFNLGLRMKSKYKVFMGDSGSFLVGFTVIWLLVFATQETSNLPSSSMQPVTALWIIAIPLMDMALVMIRRLIKGQSPFKADRTHIHHILIAYGVSARMTLCAISFNSIVIAAVGIALELYGVNEATSLISFLILFAGYSMIVSLIRSKTTSDIEVIVAKPAVQSDF